MVIPVGVAVQLSCLWEATARKAGNVHRFADFDDLTYADFLASAAAIGPVLDRAGSRAVGETILEAVNATRLVCPTNSNLGMILLLAPMTAVPLDTPLEQGLEPVLRRLTLDDARAAYEAIRLAKPGGLGEVAREDVREEPTVDLRQAMALAADRDLIARQYTTGYQDVFHIGLPALEKAFESDHGLELAIIECHLRLLSELGDSLICRKLGQEVERETKARARGVLEAGFPSSEIGRECFRTFDSWLRTGNPRRNPGATADLAAACLFAALREGIIKLPLDIPWKGHFEP